MLGPTAERLLGRAAGRALCRIRHDRGTGPVQLSRIFSHLEEHLFDSELSVRSLLSACQLAESAAGAFRRATGSTPGSYIETLRLETATHLLANSELPIWQVAELVGYASPRTFRRAYKRRFGRNPKDQRQSEPASSAAMSADVVLERPFELQVIERAHAEAVWDQLTDRGLEEQRSLLGRHPDLATPSLFWLLCDEGMERGRLDPGISQTLTQLALTCAEILEPEAKMGGSPLRSVGWAFVGSASSFASRWPEAEQAFTQAEHFLPPADLDPTAVGAVGALQAAMLWQQRQPRAAYDLALSSADLLRRGQHPLILVRCLQLQVVLSAHLGISRKAYSLFEESLAILDQHDSPYERLITLQHLVVFQIKHGYGDAEGTLATAVDLCEQIEGTKAIRMYLLWAESYLWLSRGRPRRAVGFLEHIKAQLNSARTSETVIINLDLACVHSLMGDDQRVVELAQEALELSAAMSWNREHRAAFKFLERAIRKQQLNFQVLNQTRKELGQISYI